MQGNAQSPQLVPSPKNPEKAFLAVICRAAIEVDFLSLAA